MLFAYVFELLRGFPFFFYSEVEKIDDIGWKAKLKIPPKDRRVQTSVSPTLLHACGSFQLVY
jgi:hypothetical protein